MSLKVYINGTFYNKEDAKVSVYDHGLLYGDGIFEGIRAYAGRIFEVDAHVRRLLESARAIRLAVPMTHDQIVAAMEETLKINNFTDAYIRLIVTRGIGALGISPAKTSDPQVIVIADTIELYPPEMYENGMAIITCSTIRNHPNSLSPRIKSLNYLNNILGKIEAMDAGVPEAIMLNHLGYVSECTADNIFIVRREQLITPPPEAGILEGVTRGIVMQLAAERGVPVFETNIVRYDLYTAEECFLTGTGAEIVPVTKIDGRIIGDGKPGPVTRDLIAGFHKFVRGHTH